ncbi:hypothetical protein BWR13_22520 [Escherichia coli]|nr:hypothetical protein BWR13_22520 [Escherichia coli]
MHYSRMQRKARNFPVSSLWFQGYGALAGFNAYVFSEGNRQSGKFAWASYPTYSGLLRINLSACALPAWRWCRRSRSC